MKLHISQFAKDIPYNPGTELPAQVSDRHGILFTMNMRGTALTDNWNTEAIVRRFNAHDALVAALSVARDRMMGSSPAIAALREQTDAALALARGE